MTLTLDQAWAEFKVADCTPTAIHEGTFQARCPVCRGQAFIALDPDGRVIVDCWTTGCTRQRIGDELSFASGAAMLNQQQPPVNGTAPPQPGGSTQDRKLILTAASTITPAPVRWLMRGLVPLRGVVVIAGDPGLGKSIFTNAWFVAQVTRGLLEGDFAGTAADVLVATAEDDWASVVVPRLMAAGADLARVHLVAVEAANGDRLLTVPDDLDRVDHALADLAGRGTPAALFVVDPISAFLSDAIDTHRDAQVRRALAPLADIAVRRDLVAAAVAHQTKDQSQRLLQRVSGATAFGAAPRSVLAFARHPDDPDGDSGPMRAIVHAKSNWGKYSPTLAARVEGRDIDLPDGKRMETGYLVMLGETDVSAEDLQRPHTEDGQDVREAIIAALTEGSRPSREVKTNIVAELGVGRRTVERVAGQMVQSGELEIVKKGFPPTSTWTLCNGANPIGANEDGGNELARILEPKTDGQNADSAKDPALARMDEYRRHRDRMLGEPDD